MFYEGDIRSGITTAIQQSRYVACFVRDDEAESATWEKEFLTDKDLSPLLADKTVLLRLEAESENASFLGALFPIPKTPTLVLIHNGQLKEYLAAGISRDDFVRRLVLALRDTIQQTNQAGVQAHGQPTVSPSSSNPQIREASAEDVSAEGQSRAVRDVLEERRTRLEAKKKESDAVEKAERAAKAAARQEAIAAGAPPGSKKAADLKYALQQKKRQQDARDDRARILKRVEDDKVERREKENLRKEQARLASGESLSEKPHESLLSNGKPPMAKGSKECALQVRLFDGATIRTRFPSGKNIRIDVRQWVDNQRVEGDVPYNFKQVLTPLPNRTITISEEEQSLDSLGLTPSATLILVPIQGYTSVYDGGASAYLTRGLSAGYGLVSSGIGLVTGTVGSLLSSPANSGSLARDGEGNASSTAVVNVRTLGDHHGTQDDHQFYNGNALNFEPRRDDEDAKKQD